MSTQAIPRVESGVSEMSKGADPEAIAQMIDLVLSEGYTYQHIHGVDDSQMEAMYAYAYDLQKRGRYEKAERAFHYLCYLDHYEEKHWIALGFCREKRGEYSNAIAAYYVAGTLVPDNPVPALRSAECLMLMGALDGAKQAAELTIANAAEHPGWARQKTRAEFLLKVIQKRLSSDQQP